MPGPNPTPLVLTPDQKAELKKHWYNTDQLDGVKRYYLKELKGVEVLGCVENFGKLNAAVNKTSSLFYGNKKDVVNFAFLIKSKKGGHFVDITIAKDPQNPDKILVVTQDSAGRPLSGPGVMDALKLALESKFGSSNITYVDCKVRQQVNNFDCGPLVAANGVDVVAAIKKCELEGKSIIAAAAEENGKYFQNRLLIQKPENLIKLRETQAAVLKSKNISTKGVAIVAGSIAEQVEKHHGGDTPFEYKRKKPLCQEDEFKTLHEPKQEAKKAKKRPYSFTNPGDFVAGAITGFVDRIVFGLGFEKKPEPPKPTPTPTGGNAGKSQPEEGFKPKPIEGQVLSEARQLGTGVNTLDTTPETSQSYLDRVNNKQQGTAKVR